MAETVGTCWAIDGMNMNDVDALIGDLTITQVLEMSGSMGYVDTLTRFTLQQPNGDPARN